MLNRVRRALGVSLAAALIVTACGGGAAPDTSDPGGSAGASPDGESPSIVVGATGTYFALAPAFIAHRAGYFEEEGLDVQFEVLKPSGAGAALTGGSVQFLTSAATDPLAMAVQGLPIMAVLGFEKYLSLDLVVSNEAVESRGLSKDMQVEDKFRALEGMRIAVSGPGASTDVFVKWMLSQVGLDPERSVTTTAAAQHGERVAALTSGQVDAFVSGPPATIEVERDGEGVVLLQASTGEIDYFGDEFLYEVGFTTKEFAEQNPETVRKLNRAILRANELFLTDPETAAEVMLANDFSQLDPEMLNKTIADAKGGFDTDGRMTAEQWGRVLEFAKLSGAITGDVDVAEGGFWTNDLIP